MWARPPSFATLVRIILEQQVSLASARAVFKRLTRIVTPFSAHRFRRITPARLQRAGMTRQKRAYCYHLAEALVRKRLCLIRLHRLADDEVRKTLMQVKGIGPWTADVYLLMALRRPDVWPRGDLALKAALVSLKGLAAVPSDAQFKAYGNAYRPWRAVAARILWHSYLKSHQDRRPKTS